jgi:drug/metabolite transporter (DMT)-like permease
MVLAAFFFSTLDATAKHLTGEYPALQVVWARFFGQTLLIVLWLLATRRLGTALATGKPGLQALRSILQIATGLLFFLSLSRMGLVEASAIADVSPVLITLGAALFLGERIGPRRIFGVISALCGAILIIRPGSEVFSPWAFLPLAAALCYAGFVIATRKLGPGESVATSVFYAGMLGTLVMSAGLPFYWQPVAAGDFWAYAALGVLGGCVQMALVSAFARAEASAIAPFAYAGLIFAALWGYVVFGEVPDRWTILGALVIVAAGLYVWHRETQLAQTARVARQTTGTRA